MPELFLLDLLICWATLSLLKKPTQTESISVTCCYGISVKTVYWRSEKSTTINLERLIFPSTIKLKMKSTILLNSTDGIIPHSNGYLILPHTKSIWNSSCLTHISECHSRKKSDLQNIKLLSRLQINMVSSNSRLLIRDQVIHSSMNPLRLLLDHSSITSMKDSFNKLIHIMLLHSWQLLDYLYSLLHTYWMLIQSNQNN